MSFLKYTGDVEEIKYFKFEMNDNNIINGDKFIEVASPAIDVNFKTIFENNKEILRSLLNSLIFPETERIEEIEILPTIVPGYKKYYYNLDYIRLDILCACYLLESPDDEESKVLIDLQMIIDFNKNEINKYMNYLKNIYKENIIALALDFKHIESSYYNNGFKSSSELDKCKLNDEIEIIEDIPIYRIFLYYAYKSIFERNEKFWVINEDNVLKNKGREWIKFFNIPNWCGYFKENYYLLPPFDNKFFESNEVKLAIQILANEDRYEYEMQINAQLNSNAHKRKIESMKNVIKKNDEKIKFLERKLEKLKKNKK